MLTTSIRSLLFAAALAAAALALPGCRLSRSAGPVPEEVAAGRQFAQQGAAAFSRGQYAEAEQLLAKAVKSSPADADARRYYADALWHGGDRAKAVEQMREALRLAPDDAGLHARLAEMQLALGQPDQARRTVEDAIDLNPRLGAAWAVRGRILRASGETRQALADLLRALAQAPDDRGILLDVAEVYRELSEPQRALQTLQNLAETYAPGEEPQQVLYLMGLAHLALGRHDEASEQFAAAARREPNAEILYALAEAERRAGRPAEAATAVGRALALDPQHQPSLQLVEQLRLAAQPHRPAPQ